MSGPLLSPPILSSRGLTKRFGDRIACRDVDFDLWPGEVLGVVGEFGLGQDHPPQLPGRSAHA